MTARARSRGSTRLVAAIVAVGFLPACHKGAPNQGGWFVESYQQGVLTVSHEGKTYKAVCDTSRSFNNAASITDPRNVIVFQSCDLAIELVGSTVQGFGGKQKDSQGNVVNMWNVGSSLALRSRRDERTPWRQDEFRITEVALRK